MTKHPPPRSAEFLSLEKMRDAPFCVWFYGDEILLRSEATDAFRRHWCNEGFSDRVVIDSPKMTSDVLSLESKTRSLFSQKRLIELRFQVKPTFAQGKIIEKLLKDNSPDMRWLISSAKLDKALLESNWCKTVAGNAWLIPVYPVDRKSLPAWVSRRLSMQNQRADSDLCMFIAECVEGNLLSAHQEIQKIGLLFPPGDLPAEEVRSVIFGAARYDIFEWVGSVLLKDTVRALKSLRGLMESSQPASLVLWSLSDVLHNLLVLREALASGQQVSTALQAARIFRPKDQWYKAALQRPDLNMAGIARLMQAALKIDQMIKGIIDDDVWRALRDFVTEFSGARSYGKEGSPLFWDV